MSEPAVTDEEYQAQIAAEYGQYRAKGPITYDGVLAYPPGAPVPASNVKKHGYLKAGLVEEVKPSEKKG